MELQLPYARTQQYLRHHRYDAMLAIVSPLYHVITPPQKVINFKRFIELYLDVVELPAIDGDTGAPTRLTSVSSAWEHFKNYAYTEYGAGVIAQMVNEPLQYKGFVIKGRAIDDLAGAGGTTGLEGGYIVLPKVFPKIPNYPIGGQLIDPVAVIHHEFYHTVLRYGLVSKDILLDDEREAVLFAENPARLKNVTFNGIVLEPRYTYYKKQVEKTINIMTGEQKSGQFTVDKHDITKLVPVGSRAGL